MRCSAQDAILKCLPSLYLFSRLVLHIYCKVILPAVFFHELFLFLFFVISDDELKFKQISDMMFYYLSEERVKPCLFSQVWKEIALRL